MEKLIIGSRITHKFETDSTTPTDVTLPSYMGFTTLVTINIIEMYQKRKMNTVPNSKSKSKFYFALQY